MPFTGKQLIDYSLELWQRQQDQKEQEKLQRLADHYEVEPLTGAQYFPQYYRESNDRYKKRPKAVLPLANATVDVLADATVGNGAQVVIGDPDSKENKFYQEIQKHNDLDGYNALAMGQIAGVFGWGMERVLLLDNQKIEFERVDPLYFKVIHDHGAIGRTVKRPMGVTFSTFYDPDSGTAIPRDTVVGASDKSVRVEVITPDQWLVYLNNELTPVDPVDPDKRWMPRDDGKNPYGLIPSTILWNMHHIRQFAGRSDIDPGFGMAEEINRVYSQMIYNLRMLFPTLTIPKAGTEASPLEMGIGIALRYSLDGQPPNWIIPPFDVSAFMDPLKAMLTLFFSMVHTPASAHGLGTIFGQQTYESGKAKFYEMGSLARHVTKKRTNFTTFIEQRWANLATVANAPAPYGLNAGLDVTAPVNVEFPTDVVPVSDQEFMDEIVGKMKAQLVSHIEAILLSRDWEDTPENREKAQAVINEVGAAATAVQPKSAVDQLLEEQLGGGLNV